MPMTICRFVRPALAVGLILTLAAIGAVIAVSAQQARAPRLVPNVGLTVDDYIEITQVYGLYTRDIDPGTRRSAHWSFTPNGVAVMERTVKGSQVTEYYENVVKRARKNGTRHMTTSYVVVGTPGRGVRGSAYNLGVQRTAEGRPLEFQGLGKYEDTLVNTRDGWRFAKRVSIRDEFIGSDKVLPPSPMPGVTEQPWEYTR